MNRDEAINLFTIALSNFSSPYVNEMTRETWVQCLKDCSYETGKKNLMDHIKNSSFFPTIADLIKPMEKVSFHESGKQIMIEYTKEVKENRKNAVPCPEDIKNELKKLFENGD